MTNRDRLMKLLCSAISDVIYNHKGLVEVVDYIIENGVVVLDTKIISTKNRPLIQTVVNMPLNDVLELVKAKQEERIIVPPCKVGQTVYYIAFGKVYKGKCHAITIHKDSLQIHLYDYDGDNASISAKDVFLSKEKAAEELKKRGKENGKTTNR